jgi:hypothetical protein
MLDLDSDRWERLSAAGGHPKLVPRLIRSLSQRPTPGDWAEVWEQVSHQWTLYSSAYAALPHLLRLGIAQGICTQPDFMLGLGRVAAPLERAEPAPEDLKPAFDEALREAADVTIRAAKTSAYQPKDYLCVLQAAAALNGRRGPGTQLFFSLFDGSPELECPGCGAYLCGEMLSDGLYLQSVDSHMRPLSKKARAIPRAQSAARWKDDNPPEDDFEWLEALCREAGQEQVSCWLGCLYGRAACPVCGAELSIMQEVERSHGV